MSAADRSAFETDLAANAELKQAYEAYLQANEVVEQGIENNLRTQLQEWAGEQTAQSPLVATKTVGSKVVSMSSNWARLAVAASVALLIGWFGWQWAGSTYSDQSIYAGYYEKPAVSDFRSVSGISNPLQPGFDALQANNLTSAISSFASIPADNEYYAEAQYYLGHAALQSAQSDDAIAAFVTCIDSADARFREKAEWNLVLTYIAAGDSHFPEVTLGLEKIAGNPAHSFHKQAISMQQELTSFWRKIAKRG